jgi:hypothetical protein
MNIRHKKPPDSLYMLLDTMCNAFGGIILLAVLVTLLTSKEKNAGGSPPEVNAGLVERQLQLAETNLQHALEFSASLQAQAGSVRLKEQFDLLATRKELQAQMANLRVSNAETRKEIDNLGSSDPADRLKVLKAQLITAQERKAAVQNSLAAIEQNVRRLRERVDAMHQQITAVVASTQRQQRPPKEHDTAKSSFYLIAQYGSIYACKDAEMKKNDLTISWTSEGLSQYAHPIQGRGYHKEDAAKLRNLLSRLPKERVFLAFCVFEDSFSDFNWAKELATAAGLDYGWTPLRNGEGPVGFSIAGHDPKPQ